MLVCALEKVMNLAQSRQKPAFPNILKLDLSFVLKNAYYSQDPAWSPNGSQ